MILGCRETSKSGKVRIWVRKSDVAAYAFWPSGEARSKPASLSWVITLVAGN